MVPKEHESAPNGISIGSAVFAYTAVKSPNAFQWGGQPQKLPLPLDTAEPPSNTWFLGLT